MADMHPRHGTSLEEMVRVLRDIDLYPLIVKSDWPTLNETHQPMILLLKEGIIGHYVLLDKINDTRIHVIDPPNTHMWKREDFLRKFTGYAIVVCGSSNEVLMLEKQLGTSNVSHLAGNIGLGVAIGCSAFAFCGFLLRCYRKKIHQSD